IPSLFLSAATATRSTERTFVPKLGAPTIQVSQISFVFWFVKPVRLKRLARFWAFRAPTVVVDRSTIKPGSFSSMPGAKTPGKGARFWCVVGPVNWKSAPLAARLGYRRARSTKKPLLCIPATSSFRGEKTSTCTAEVASFEAFFPVAVAVAVAATTAASATRERAVSSVRLCTGISFSWMALLRTKDTVRRRVFPENAIRGSSSSLSAREAPARGHGALAVSIGEHEQYVW